MSTKKKSSHDLVAKKPTGVKLFPGVRGERAKFVLPSDVATAGSSGAQPHSQFQYHGGPVVLNPQAFSVFLGDWSGSAQQARMARLNQSLKDLVVSKYMNILSQYGCGQKGTFIGSTVLSNADRNLSEKDIHPNRSRLCWQTSRGFDPGEFSP